ncbi:hypothetical protein SP41_73 [Salmonella phage 41]|nr:hypothetical protein SP41_73 [Salmonella phage 41]
MKNGPGKVVSVLYEQRWAHEFRLVHDRLSAFVSSWLMSKYDA